MRTLCLSSTVTRTLIGLMLLFAVVLTPLLGVAQAPPVEAGIHPGETCDGVRENINLATGGLNVMYSVEMSINSPFFTGTCGAWNVTGCLGVSAGSITRSNEMGFGPTRPVYINGDYNHKCMGVYFLWFGDGSIYTFFNLRTSCQYWVGTQQVGYWQADPTSDIRDDYDTRGEGFHADLSGCRLTLKDGTFYPLTGCSGNPPGDGVATGVIEDPNGNQITTSTGLISTDTDTLGRAITIGGNGSSPIQYRDSNGVLRTITINYSTFTVFLSLTLPGRMGALRAPFQDRHQSFFPTGSPTRCNMTVATISLKSPTQVAATHGTITTASITPSTLALTVGRTMHLPATQR